MKWLTNERKKEAWQLIIEQLLDNYIAKNIGEADDHIMQAIKDLDLLLCDGDNLEVYKQ